MLKLVRLLPIYLLNYLQPVYYLGIEIFQEEVLYTRYKIPIFSFNAIGPFFPSCYWCIFGVFGEEICTGVSTVVLNQIGETL